MGYYLSNGIKTFQVLAWQQALLKLKGLAAVIRINPVIFLRTKQIFDFSIYLTTLVIELGTLLRLGICEKASLSDNQT